MNPPAANVLRVLIATDNHLGFLSSDPIRGEDSFNTLDEILQIGRDRHCDCAFFSGDLFHHNKPSRRVMYRAQQVFKSHVFGPGPVRIQVTSDQRENFGGRVANYEDPSLSVQFPIFMIHGNHDDPCREGPLGMPLSAIDVLAEAGLVNYFGRADAHDDIKIKPVIIEKGTAKVALYGLGWVRDERLHRTFVGKRVSFVRAANEGDGDGEGVMDALNVMLIHQNRAQRGRGEKNGVAENMIPDFMDLVFWGHEHECEIKPVEKGSFFLSQPGSSIAVSLVEGEAVPKHCAILDIMCDPEPKYRLVPVLLKSVRPFLLDTSLELALVPELNKLNLPEQEKQERVFDFLTKRVQQMVREYQSKEFEEREGDGEERPIPIVRIKVEHTGFTTINLQRFGAQFTSKVANPDDILQFYRKKKQTTSSRSKREGSAAGEDGAGEASEEEEGEELAFQTATERIHRLSEQVLRESAQRLELLAEHNLHLAVEEFVVKENATSIAEFAEETMARMRKALRKDRVTGLNEAAVAQAVAKERERDDRNERLESKPVAAVVSTTSSVAAAATARDGYGTEEEAIRPVARSRIVVTEDEEEEEEEKRPVKKTAAASKKSTRPAAVAKKPASTAAAAKARKRNDSPATDFSMEEEAPVPKRGARTAVAKRPKFEENDDEDDDEDAGSAVLLSQAKFGVKNKRAAGT